MSTLTPGHVSGTGPDGEVGSEPRDEEGATRTGYVGPIESQTLKNAYFRRVLFTGKHAQLVVMCLQPGEEIVKEVHTNVDQFFRIEQGEAKFVFNEQEEHVVPDADAILVPAGTYRDVINVSTTKPLKLYTIYSPPPPNVSSEAEAVVAAACPESSDCSPEVEVVAAGLRLCLSDRRRV